MIKVVEEEEIDELKIRNANQLLEGFWLSHNGLDSLDLERGELERLKSVSVSFEVVLQPFSRCG